MRGKAHCGFSEGGAQSGIHSRTNAGRGIRTLVDTWIQAPIRNSLKTHTQFEEVYLWQTPCVQQSHAGQFPLEGRQPRHALSRWRGQFLLRCQWKTVQTADSSLWSFSGLCPVKHRRRLRFSASVILFSPPHIISKYSIS